MINEFYAIILVYQHHETCKIRCEFVGQNIGLKNDPAWEHIDTLEPRTWIELNYGMVQHREKIKADMVGLLNALEAIVKTLVDQDEEGLIEHSEQIIAARLAIKNAKR